LSGIREKRPASLCADAPGNQTKNAAIYIEASENHHRRIGGQPLKWFFAVPSNPMGQFELSFH
jgi:hypothetical protein